MSDLMQMDVPGKLTFGRILFLTSVVLLPACQTTDILFHQPDDYLPFKGTTLAGKKFIRSFDKFTYYGEQNLWLADVPFCLVADVILLPYGVYNMMSPPIER
jgi:uncharacterized protein YceK